MSSPEPSGASEGESDTSHTESNSDDDYEDQASLAYSRSHHAKENEPSTSPSGSESGKTHQDQASPTELYSSPIASGSDSSHSIERGRGHDIPEWSVSQPPLPFLSPAPATTATPTSYPRLKSLYIPESPYQNVVDPGSPTLGGQPSILQDTRY